MYINLRKSLRSNITYFINNSYDINNKDAILFLNFLKTQKALLDFITQKTDNSRDKEF
jgi:hypothetical protein